MTKVKINRDKDNITEEFRKAHVYTNNMGWLKEEDGFIHKRGELGDFMGYATDNVGNRYKIVVASCGLDNCNCGAKAISIKDMLLEKSESLNPEIAVLEETRDRLKDNEKELDGAIGKILDGNASTEYLEELIDNVSFELMSIRMNIEKELRYIEENE